jgi:hypothetical protein
MSTRLSCRALWGAAMSLLSLAALTYLRWPGHYPRVFVHKVGMDVEDVITITCFLGAAAGSILGVWAWRREAKLPAGIASALALLAVTYLVCALVFHR